MSELWRRCLQRLESDLSVEDLHTYLKPLQASEDSEGLRLLAPNGYTLDIVKAEFLPRSSTILSHLHGDAVKVRLEVGTLNSRRPPRSEMAANGEAFEFEHNLDPSYTFESFVEGKSNQLGKAAAVQVANNPGRAYNPLLLYGGTGLGKTHLMHAAGNHMRAQNRGDEGHVSALGTVRQRDDRFAAHQEHGRLQAPLPRGRCAADRRHPVPRRQEHVAGRVLPHLQRAVRRQAADHPDLRPLSEGSRQSRTAAEVAPRLGPVGRDRSAGLRDARGDPVEQGGDARGVEIPEQVAQLIARRMRSNVRDLEGALNTLVARANFLGQPITADFAQETLRDLLTVHSQSITISNIQKTVADYYQLRLSDLLSMNRSRSLARPRQMAMALTKELTEHSLPEIGKAFGGPRPHDRAACVPDGA